MAAALLLALAVAVPSLRATSRKEAALKADRTVGLAVDEEDVRTYLPEDRRAAFWKSLRAVPVSIAILRPGVSAASEQALRADGFRIHWRIEPEDSFDALVDRVRPGDGLFVADEKVLELPQALRVIDPILAIPGVTVAATEFAPARLLSFLAKRAPFTLVRFHLIPCRETLSPNADLFRARLVRAARERWARLLCFRFAASWTAEQNLQFLSTVSQALRAEGFELGEPAPVPAWPRALGGGSPGSLLAIFLAVFAPLAGIAWLRLPGPRSPFLRFSLMTLGSALAGVIIHGLLASPLAAAGAHLPRGVKLQLMLPLAGAAVLLLTAKEIRAWMNEPIRWRDAFFALFVVGTLSFLYLTRSGNLPLLPVTGAERSFRDWLEQALAARPRFKEFAVGHPLMLAGLVMWRRGMGGGFWRDGRALILAGLVGQISVVNTFLHVQTPIETGLLRTFHGWWIGSLLSLPLATAVTALDRRKRNPVLRVFEDIR